MTRISQISCSSGDNCKGTFDMPTHSIETVHISGTNEVRKTVSKTASGEANLSETIPADSTDLELVIAIDFSALKMLLIVSNKALTLETNSGSVPDDTITLVADEPLVWWTGSPHSNPLTADVTSIFVTEGASDEAILDIRTLQDATP